MAKKNPENEIKTRLRWRVKRIASPDVAVPARPGLYAIGHTEDGKGCLGLEAGRVYVYIGQTDNLRRRLREHSPDDEKKLDLRKYLQDNRGKAKFWFAVAEQEQLTDMERQLIRRFVPKYNKLGKPKKESD